MLPGQAGAHVALAGFFGHDAGWLEQELEAYGVDLALASVDPSVRPFFMLFTKSY